MTYAGLTEQTRILKLCVPFALPVSLKAHSRQKFLNRVGDSSV
jgi:hypothetical protein